MKKYLWLILGILFIIPNLIFNLLFYTGFFSNLDEAGFLILALSGILEFPCWILNIEGYLCILISLLVWFVVGAGIGWLASRKKLTSEQNPD